MPPRFSADELFKILSQYDVISFDIFDTAVLRRVEYPTDIFKIIALEMRYNNFWQVRKDAESLARDLKQQSDGTREVTIDDIYAVLKDFYGIDPIWKNREIELELSLCEPNPIIIDVFNRLQLAGKTLIFVSDMYLPSKIIHSMLDKVGYREYKKLFLSNEYKLQKGDGSLQSKLLEEYPDKAIIHVGDNWKSDVLQTWNCGIPAIYYPISRLAFRENNLDTIAGSFYRGILNSRLACGNWDHDIYFTHGYRVGGILTAGFCQFVDNLAKSQGAEKILFCARDCKVIYDAYRKFWNDIPSEYIQISRHSILEVTMERYFHDFIGRAFLNVIDEYYDSKPLREILQVTGFDYLLEDLEKYDLEQFAFPKDIIDCHKRIRSFLFNCADKIRAHSQSHVDAARKYFGDVIGNARKILIVDIAWTGTCITALKYFLETQLPNSNWQIKGALLASTINNPLTLGIEEGTIQAYTYSPLHNFDLAQFMCPPVRQSIVDRDIVHMPLEFLFTSTETSLISYSLDDNRNVQFQRTSYSSENTEQIHAMQDGVLTFIEEFHKTMQLTGLLNIDISPYVAFNPLMESIIHREYTYEVFRDFTYDACTAAYETQPQKFGELIGNENQDFEGDKNHRILFINPESTRIGILRTMLIMCKVTRDLGYHPYVWSAKSGSFVHEFNKENIPVTIVTEKDLEKPEIEILVKNFSRAICNTVVADKYVKFLERFMPVVWYIHEAKDIPDFCRQNPERLELLQNSKNLVCASDYAADAIMKFTNHRPRVIHNCVEDESEMAIDYTPGRNKMIRFVQFGTIEYRKGYDILTKAYLSMPSEYRAESELHFAGGFIDSGTAFASQLFRTIKDESSIHYLGLIRDEEKKIETLSSMDVVVVASRDESCSLVALEGAMLSKPLIVTENVGAKYMIDGGNGKIVKIEDIDDLRNAMMYMIDHRKDLKSMGIQSRKNYESMANMDSYAKEFSTLLGNCIVSLTSYPARIGTTNQVIQSLLEQTVLPDKILLWLSTNQFPRKESDLPKDLVDLCTNPVFEIRFVEGDLKPHKKYFYAMQEYPELPIIIVDDDAIYDKMLVERLMENYKKYPHCISAMRTNRILFKENGEARSYQSWRIPDITLIGQPSYSLLPVGVGGVLYPPHSIPPEAFNSQAITELALDADDLWLKLWATHNNYPAILVQDFCKFAIIPRTQEFGLHKQNLYKNNNDIAWKNTLEYFEKILGKGTIKKLLDLLQSDNFI